MNENCGFGRVMRLFFVAGFVALHGVNTFFKGGCHLMKSLFKRTLVEIVFFLLGRVCDGDIFNVLL